MSVPVVFIHSGNSTYLFNTFYQLKQSNKDVLIYLIGTKESKVYSSMVHHVDINDYMGEADAFAPLYKHFSTNSPAFELICIQRWFVLNAFMLKNGIEKCLYLDSDVLLYGKIEELYPTYEKFGMTICGISGHTNFLNRSVLAEFCKYIIDRYTEDRISEKLEQHFRELVYKHGAGGVSDMTFFAWFADKFPEKVFNLNTPESQICFDISIQHGDDVFQMDNKIKKVIFKKKKPYCLHKSDNGHVLFHSLHFQGRDPKKIMQSYIQEKNSGFFFKKAYFYVHYIIQKIALKFF